jgi:hypothetical protein
VEDSNEVSPPTKRIDTGKTKDVTLGEASQNLTPNQQPPFALNRASKENAVLLEKLEGVDQNITGGHANGTLVEGAAAAQVSLSTNFYRYRDVADIVDSSDDEHKSLPKASAQTRTGVTKPSDTPAAKSQAPLKFSRYREVITIEDSSDEENQSLLKISAQTKSEVTPKPSDKPAGKSPTLSFGQLSCISCGEIFYAYSAA